MVLKALFMVPAASDFSFVYSWQTGPICSPDYVRRSEDRLYEPRSRYLRDLFKILFPNCLDHTLLSPAARSTVPS